MKLLVLEGPDGAGKSTLAQELHLRTGWPVVHTGGRKSAEDMTKAVMEANHLMNRAETPVICDRHHGISEPVYSKVLGRDTRPVPAPRGVIIYCRPTSFIHSPRDGEDPGHVREVVDRTAKLVEMYDQLLKGFVRWDWQTDHNLDLLEAYVRCACLSPN